MKFPISLNPIWKRPPVTICIGFTRKKAVGRQKRGGGIVLATDSRISVGSRITDDAHKIGRIRFRNADVLIAKAGYRHSFNRFHEMMETRAADMEIISPRTVPDLANDVIRDLQKDLLDRSHEEPLQRLKDNYCEFILGFYYGDTPYLYTIDLITRLAQKSEKPFVAIGNAEALADFLLASFNPEKLRGVEWIGHAIGIIEMCKLHDSSCGGPCRIGAIGENWEGERSVIVEDAYIEKLGRGFRNPAQAHRKLLRMFASEFRD